MTETTATATSPSPASDPMAAMAGPLRAAFAAAMTPYVSGDAVASAELTGILTEAVTAADPTPELVGALCDLIATAAPTTGLLTLMHEAVGVALGLTPAAPAGRTARPPQPRQVASAAPRPSGLRERIAELFAQSPATRWTVTELAHRLGNSSGAVGAALDRMLSNGEAALVSMSPKRYSIPTPAEASAPAPAEPESADPAPADATVSQPEDGDEASAPEAVMDEAGDEVNGNSAEVEATAEAEAPAPATRRKSAKSADA